MNMPTPETVTDAFKFTEVSLHFFEHDSANIGVVRQQIVDVGLLIIACTMVIITMTKTVYPLFPFLSEFVHAAVAPAWGRPPIFFWKISAKIRINEPSEQRHGTVFISKFYKWKTRHSATIR